jgi:hypothetical protein
MRDFVSRIPRSLLLRRFPPPRKSTRSRDFDPYIGQVFIRHHGFLTIASS